MCPWGLLSYKRDPRSPARSLVSLNTSYPANHITLCVARSSKLIILVALNDSCWKGPDVSISLSCPAVPQYTHTCLMTYRFKEKTLNCCWLLPFYISSLSWKGKMCKIRPHLNLQIQLTPIIKYNILTLNYCKYMSIHMPFIQNV